MLPTHSELIEILIVLLGMFGPPLIGTGWFVRQRWLSKSVLKAIFFGVRVAAESLAEPMKEQNEETGNTHKLDAGQRFTIKQAAQDIAISHAESISPAVAQALQDTLVQKPDLIETVVDTVKAERKTVTEARKRIGLKGRAFR